MTTLPATMLQLRSLISAGGQLELSLENTEHQMMWLELLRSWSKANSQTNLHAK